MMKNGFKWQKLLFFTIFFLWVIHLFHYIRYDKFRFQEDIVYFTDEGFWTYPARHKYLFGTWHDDKCHYNHRFFITPLFNLIEYASIKTFGLNEMGIRFPSIIFYILIVLLFTFYIVYVRKKSYLLALFILLPLFMERFFLTQFSMAVLEPLLVLLLSVSFMFFIRYKDTDQDIFLYVSLFFVVLSYFVKSHGILMALPFIVISKKSLRQKILILLIVFGIPMLWNVYVRVFHPIAYAAIKYDLFAVPRVKSFTGFFLKDYVLNPFYIFITPFFWGMIYIVLIKLPLKSIFKENSLAFTIIAIFYFTTVFVMENKIRYNLPALPAYVFGSLYIYNKRFFLRKGWQSTLLVSFVLWILQFFNYRYFINVFADKTFFLILVLWLPYLAFSYIYRYIGLSLRETLFVIFLTNSLVFIGPKIGNTLAALLSLSYIMIVNLLFVLFVFEGDVTQKKSIALPYPLFMLLLLVFISPIYLRGEIGYIRGRNRFRDVINNCILQSKINFDAVGGRAADNIMLFTQKKVLGVLSPEYEIGPSHNDEGYIHHVECFNNKKILVLGFPFKRKVSIKEDAYFNEFLHALPLAPQRVKQIGTCNFIYDIDTTNISTRVYMNLYLIAF